MFFLNYKILENDDRLVLVHNDKEVAYISLNSWETIHFSRSTGSFNIESEHFENMDYQNIYQVLDNLITRSESKYQLVEIHIEIKQYQIISVLEKLGFRLVDSRIDFITHLRKKDLDFVLDPSRLITFAKEEDLPQILELTDISYINNPNYYTRQKHSMYYSQKQTRDYFYAWILNNIKDTNAYFAVIKEQHKLIGYFIYRRQGLYNQLPLYRGILTAVDPNYRGNNIQLYMQAFLYQQFPDEEFYLYNLTQLTNKPVITNHIKSGKKINSIKLTFYREAKGVPKNWKSTS